MAIFFLTIGILSSIVGLAAGMFCLLEWLSPTIDNVVKPKYND